MVREGYIDQTQARRAAAQPIRVAKQEWRPTGTDSYALDAIRRAVDSLLGPEALELTLEMFRSEPGNSEEKRSAQNLLEWEIESQASKPLAELDERFPVLLLVGGLDLIDFLVVLDVVGLVDEPATAAGTSRDQRPWCPDPLRRRRPGRPASRR